MNGTSEGAIHGWETRHRQHGPDGKRLPDFAHPAYVAELLDRWLTVHDIRAIGERAVKETA